jgi:large subunit ribosomal protein L13
VGGLKKHVPVSRIRAPEFVPDAGTPMKTFNAKNETVKRDWFVVDATNLTLGRLAAEVASRLRGKHKPEFTPHVDTGDYIVVINAEKVRVSGNKAKGKIYYSHTGFTGGLKTITFDKLMEKSPTRAIEHAVKGMLPKGPLGRAVYSKLKVYAGDSHPHTSQQPQTLSLSL